MQQLVVLNFWSDFWIAFRQRIIEEVRIGNIGEEIKRAIEPNILFSFDIFGRPFLISDAVLVTWLVLIVIAVLGWLMGRKTEQIPLSGRQLISESLVDPVAQALPECRYDL